MGPGIEVRIREDPEELVAVAFPEQARWGLEGPRVVDGTWGPTKKIRRFCPPEKMKARPR